MMDCCAAADAECGSGRARLDIAGLRELALPVPSTPPPPLPGAPSSDEYEVLGELTSEVAGDEPALEERLWLTLCEVEPPANREEGECTFVAPAAPEGGGFVLVVRAANPGGAMLLAGASLPGCHAGGTGLPLPLPFAPLPLPLLLLLAAPVVVGAGDPAAAGGVCGPGPGDAPDTLPLRPGCMGGIPGGAAICCTGVGNSGGGGASTGWEGSSGGGGCSGPLDDARSTTLMRREEGGQQCGEGNGSVC
jgi:hypothetical protein